MRPVRERPPRWDPPSFAILCVGRVGSEHLVALLDSHPEITCFGELFAPAWGAGPARATTHVPRFFESDHDDPLAYWAEVSSPLHGQVVGLKLPHTSLKRHRRSRQLVRSPAVKIIRLRRADLLAQYVSAVMAFDSGVWQSTDGSYRQGRLRIAPERCVKGLNRIVAGETELDRVAAGHPVADLTYEELTREDCLTGLQEFLGVEPRPLTSPYERLRKVPLEEVVENYEELAAIAGDAPFADHGRDR